MRGAIGGYVFHFIAVLIAGAMTFAGASARAQTCEFLFESSNSNSTEPSRSNAPEAEVAIGSFQNRWVLSPEFVAGLRAMASWAPKFEFISATEGLLSQRTYRRRPVDDQLQILFLVLQLHVRAHQAARDEQRRLLLNTAQYFISGKSRLRIDRKAHLAYMQGDATVINPGVIFDISKPLIKRDRDYSALSTSLTALAHEVSHGLSRVTVGGRIAYLIEEYRAYQVGFVAENGRWPSKAESAAALLDVLFNPWRLEAYETLPEVFLRRWRTEPYRRLFESLSLNIENVVDELQKFRTPEFVARKNSLSAEDIDKMRANIQVRLISDASDSAPAPAFGWPGFPFNEKK